MTNTVHPYKNIYEFAASAGALEGFVYHKDSMNPDDISNWVGNLVDAYGILPRDAIDEIQPAIDLTIGRAVRSLVPLLGEEHDIVKELGSMITGLLPESSDDFQKKKWFQE